MWCLINTPANKIHFLKQEKTSIGRTGSDIVLEGDASISRVHAHLIVRDDNLYLQDAKSKYGTFLIDESSQQVGDQPKKLKNGQTVSFGKLNNKWICQHVVHKTATSMLAQDTKVKISKILAYLKVEISENFDCSCSHLTMSPQTMVSIKLLYALALCKPIVTPSYWIAYKESIEKDLPLPENFKFQPKIKEDSHCLSQSFSLAPNEDRKKLFAGKTFLFMSSSQMNEYKDVIRSAGGKATSMTQVRVSVKECCAKNSIVVQPKESETQSQNEATALKIKAAIAESKRRIITEIEIGLALLHCSIDQWCNPDFLYSSLLPSKQSAQLTIAKTTKVLVAATESIDFAAPSTSRVRNRSKKFTGTVVASINLDSDEEVEVVNKENVPEIEIVVDEKVQTESNFSIEQTQETQYDERIRNISLPQTQNTVDTNCSITGTEDSFVTASDFNTRSLRSGSSSTQVESSFKQAEVSSIPMSSSNLFNFIDTSIAKQPRKRKISENADVISVVAKKTKNQKSTTPSVEPKNKKNIQVMNIDSSDEETEKNKSTRKRTAAEALGNDGGLFNFNTNFIKKTKAIEDESQQVTNRVTGIIPLIKSNQVIAVSTATTFKNSSYDNEDSGIWLSKKMTSFNLRDSDSVKIEVKEPFESTAMDQSEDIKPKLETLFDVLETTAHNCSASSLVFKRKSFVKKQNFRPQSCIVTTKLMLVDETHKQLTSF